MSRSPALRHRSARRVPAVIASLCLLALGVLAVWAAVARLAQGRWPAWLESAGSTVAGQQWNAPWVIVAAVVAALLGLVCLIAAVKPGPPSAWRLDAPAVGSDEPSTELVISRRGVARLAAANADLVDGVDRVTAKAGNRAVQLTVRMPDTEGAAGKQAAQAIREQVTSTVHQALTATGLADPVRVRTVVR